MNILLLKGYNNYFNRIMKKEDSLAAYKTAVNKYYEYASVNFNPNDGITTELIIGSGGKDGQAEPDTLPIPLKWEYEGTPDYLIAYEGTSIIRSRWFIMESERTRNGQYRIALKRDILADYQSDILNSPCFVEKGTITERDNPLIFNAEGMSFNQIKKNEILLKDETKCAWLVGYLKKDLSATSGITYTFPADIGEDILVAGDLEFADCIKYYDTEGNEVAGTGTKTCAQIDKANSKFCFNGKYRDWDIIESGGQYPASVTHYFDDYQRICYDFNLTTKTISDSDSRLPNERAAVAITGPSQNSTYSGAYNWLKETPNRIKTDGTIKAAWDALYNNMIASLGSQNVFTDLYLSAYNNRLITRNSKIYRLHIGQGTSYKPYKTYTGNDAIANTFFNSLYQTRVVNNETFTLNRDSSNAGSIKANFALSCTQYTITATEEILGETMHLDLPASSTRNTVSDALFDMFCMPVSPKSLGMSVGADDMYIYNNNTALFRLESITNNQLAMATALCTELGADSTASKVYDLQLLPYCPMDLKTGITSGKEYIDISDLTATIDYTIFTKGSGNDETNAGIIFYPKKSNFTKYIPLVLANMHESYETLTENGFTLIFSGSYDEDNYPIYTYHFPVQCSDRTIDWANLTLPSVITSMFGVAGPTLDNGYPGFYCSLMLPIQEVPATLPFSNVQVSLLAHWLIQDGPEELKIANECDFQRLVSPNFNGMFEFKKSRLNDGVHYINADCTYKPFTPYIKLNPDFSGLYGQDFNDSTGLICGGDFSLPMLNDSFRNFELQNKNYQAIFDRQIQNLDVNQQIAKEQQQITGAINIATAGIGSAAGGAMAGFKAGGGIGAAVGGVLGGTVGTVLSGVGYEYDKQFLQRSQEEARSYAIDNFNYQLGNIRALPQTITKSSPLSFNNKVWPILEEFSCTDEEKEVLKNKLRYDGMTIMAVGTLDDYAVDGGYLKGKLIRLPDLKDDFHVADAIYQVVDRGFYKGV